MMLNPSSSHAAVVATPWPNSTLPPPFNEMLAASVEPIPKRLTTLPTPSAALYLVLLFFLELSSKDSRFKVMGGNLTGHRPFSLLRAEQMALDFARFGARDGGQDQKFRDGVG